MARLAAEVAGGAVQFLAAAGLLEDLAGRTSSKAGASRLTG